MFNKQNIIFFICILLMVSYLGYGLVHEKKKNVKLPENTGLVSNKSQAYKGYINEPRFSHLGGFYHRNLSLSISGYAPGATVYYTTDGSVPTDKSTAYTSPILISKNTVVRALVIDANGNRSAVVTHSYLVEGKHTLSTVSISMNPKDLWNEETGIYVLGKHAQTKFPYKGANFWQEWEKPIFLEYYESKGKFAFSMNAGIKIFGGTSRTIKQRSLAVFARSKYGKKKISYRLFEDKEIIKFNSIVLRNAGQDFYKTHFRDGMVANLLKPIGLDIQAYKPVVLYLNGQYWGVYDMREKVDKDFLAANHGVSSENVDLLEGNCEVKEGDAEHYKAMLDFISTHDLTKKENYAYVQTQMDVENFVDYEISQIYIANTDWPKHNIRYWRPKSSDGKWRWIVYDADFSFENFGHNTLAFATDPHGEGDNKPFSTFLLRMLLENNAFRNLFLERFAYHLDNTFRPEQVIALIDNTAAQLEPEMKKHFARWGGSMEKWRQEVQKLREFAAKRPAQVKKHIQTKFGLSKKEMIHLGFD